MKGPNMDINASHILIKLPGNPTPEDTLAAYEKIIGNQEQDYARVKILKLLPGPPQMMASVSKMGET